MKNLFLYILFSALFACSESPRNAAEPFPNFLTEDLEWISYEGVLFSKNGQPVLTELHLAPGTPGMDSYYKITESFSSSDSLKSFSGTISSRGKYSLLFGSPEHNIIQLIDKRKLRSLMRRKLLSHPDLVHEALYLKSYGEHELILVNENLEEVKPRCKLRRRSDLFTVEGYFTVYNDTSEYFERNTRKTWSVARLAHYDEAVRKYEELATQKFEGIYLKALSYSVRQIDKDGNEIDALVFKRILQMDSTGGMQHP